MIEDRNDRRLALAATGLLREFNEADVLHAADVHVATRLGGLMGETRDEVLLAVALVVRAARNGSVCVDLTTIADLPLEEGVALPWPDAEAWLAQVRESPLLHEELVHLEGDQLSLDRYWREEGQVCADLLARLDRTPPAVDEQALATGLARIFDQPGYEEQRAVAEASARRWTTVLTGGPGTGKTTTVARLLALVAEQHELSTGRAPRIAMCAPTAKASIRLKEAVAEATAELTDAVDRDRLAGIPSSTLHRLLGWRGGGTRFKHDRAHRLPHDVIVVDETSMVSLTHMARLLEALRPTTRLVLVGDADQLASVEAGAVLADVVAGLGDRADTPVSRLVTTHRYGRRIGALADAVRAGDADAVLHLLHTQGADVPVDDPADDSRIELVDPANADAMAAFDADVCDAALAVREAAEQGDARGAVRALDRYRLLCAHRAGPFGVSGWNHRVERLLSERLGVTHYEQWYAGRPVLVTANDYGLDLYNGDLGVTVRAPDGRLRVAVAGAGGTPRDFATTRLADVETVYAMTVHKSQGSQADVVSVVMPEEDSRLLTRELFYTAVTRAQKVVRVVGTEASIRAALERQVQRASGLASRLRDSQGGPMSHSDGE